MKRIELFNREQILQEYKKGFPETRDYELESFELGFLPSKPGTTIYLREKFNNSIEDNFQFIDFAFFTSSKKIINKKTTLGKTLANILIFDQTAKKEILSPYGIFVKSGNLYVSDSNQNIRNGILCGLYYGKLLSKEEAEKFSLHYS